MLLLLTSIGSGPSNSVITLDSNIIILTETISAVKIFLVIFIC